MSEGAGGLDVIRRERIKGRIGEFLRNHEKKRKQDGNQRSSRSFSFVSNEPAGTGYNETI